MSFWDAIEQHVAELDESDGTDDAPDPWADIEVDGVELTKEQVAYLAGLYDQPAVPHLEGEDAAGD